MAPKNSTDTKVRPFVFESFGVIVKIDGNTQEIVDDAANVARDSLLNLLKPAKRKKADQLFQLKLTKSGYKLWLNGEGLASCRGKKKFFKFFDAIMRITVGEHAADRVFMHAGAVGWKGKAIVLPGEAFRGKSTIVTELVKKGAEYYSDDFAIFDENGFLYPFPRIIGMRTRDGHYRPYSLTVESLGGKPATEPIPVGLVLFTEYEPGAKWKPVTLTAGQGVLEMIPFVL